ncbi:cupin domain-containing protein [Halioxenophilus sp. WMMB6]|uniref:cupin domain-containing protein n=1 Tax=Halioxenophilus sp. WMMB6 TaxID=3073815 RepID=UPI00295EA864|nr:cupin domain-containing protein [Halioxenophilus sp. WMMB6]
MNHSNIFDSIPENLKDEKFEEIVNSPTVRIERILSKGHRSPAAGWYDQDENEWVMVISGHATIEFEDGNFVKLSRGDHLNIPAHRKHKVSWTDPSQITLWLVVFYG